MTKKEKIIVVIPAYNEEHSIGSVVRRVLRNSYITWCVVVDDGSSDQTADIAKKYGARVIRNAHNIGTGPSISIGLRLAEKERADSVILMDADGQHDSKYIPQLVREIHKGADYAIASRYICSTKNTTTFLRILGTRYISFWSSLWFGTRIFDVTSGYRALNRRVLRELLHFYPTFFSEPEIILDMLEKKFVMHEISCQMKKRNFGRSSISSLKAFWLMIYIFFKILWRGIWWRINTALACYR